VTLATAVFALVSTGQLKLRIERCYSFAELRPDLNVDGFICHLAAFAPGTWVIVSSVQPEKPVEIKSAANEAKLLKRKLMRTVPDRTLNAVADRNTPNPKL